MRTRRRRPFDLYKSIWKPRCKTSDSCDLFETKPEVLSGRLMGEWHVACIQGALRHIHRYDDDAEADADGDGEADEAQEVAAVLCRHERSVYAIFTHYAAHTPSLNVLSLRAWRTLVDECGLVEKKSKHCTWQHCASLRPHSCTLPSALTHEDQSCRSPSPLSRLSHPNASCAIAYAPYSVRSRVCESGADEAIFMEADGMRNKAQREEEARRQQQRQAGRPSQPSASHDRAIPRTVGGVTVTAGGGALKHYMSWPEFLIGVRSAAFAPTPPLYSAPPHRHPTITPFLASCCHSTQLFDTNHRSPSFSTKRMRRCPMLRVQLIKVAVNRFVLSGEMRDVSDALDKLLGTVLQQAAQVWYFC